MVKHNIQLIPSHQIDKVKWNACIEANANGLIYSTYDYLNTMCDNWHGLIINDYDAVMPLPWRTKLGIRYGYTPAFMQQLGLTGNCPDIDIAQILNSIRDLVHYADIHFNFSNFSVKDHASVVTRTNLVIPLSAGYETIYSNYKQSLRDNIKKAEQANLVYADAIVETAIALYRLHYSERIAGIKEKDFERFSSLCQLLQKKKQCFARSVKNEQGEFLSTGLFLKDNKRIYNLMNTTLPAGRDKEANHFLLDSLIREFADQSLIFDFEGSDLPGVKFFYESFGAVNEPYFHYHYNGLPWPLRLLKH